MTPPEAPRVAVAWAEGADRSLPLPAYRSAGAAGADLHANLPEGARAQGLTLAPGARAAVPTGLRLAIPPGWEGQVRMRSGLALRHGLSLPNAPGTVDADYRGEVLVIVQNGGAEPVTVQHGDRIAQLVLAPVARAAFALGELDATSRGAAGFGSTGVRP
jgi:dUTP pyrophosphatase